jgi:hypothetical protein
MPIVASDIQFLYTVKTGSNGYSTASSGASSLGKYVSSTQVVAGANGLYDDISGAENAANTADFRAVGVLNNHGTLALQNAVVYISAETAGGASVALAVDTVAASAKASASAQGDQIANETTAPTGIAAAFSTACTSAATGLSLGTINAGYVKVFWVRRTAANTVAVDSDGATFAISGDTAA